MCAYIDYPPARDFTRGSASLGISHTRARARVSADAYNVYLTAYFQLLLLAFIRLPTKYP